MCLGGFLLSLPVFLPCLWLLLRPRGGEERSKFRHLRQVRRRRSVHQLPGMKCTSSPNWFPCVCMCVVVGEEEGIKKEKRKEEEKKFHVVWYVLMESSVEHLMRHRLLCNLCKRVREAKANFTFTHSSYQAKKRDVFSVVCQNKGCNDCDVDTVSLWNMIMMQRVHDSITSCHQCAFETREQRGPLLIHRHFVFCSPCSILKYLRLIHLYMFFP